MEEPTPLPQNEDINENPQLFQMQVFRTREDPVCIPVYVPVYYPSVITQQRQSDHLDDHVLASKVAQVREVTDPACPMVAWEIIEDDDQSPEPHVPCEIGGVLPGVTEVSDDDDDNDNDEDDDDDNDDDDDDDIDVVTVAGSTQPPRVSRIEGVHNYSLPVKKPHTRVYPVTGAKSNRKNRPNTKHVTENLGLEGPAHSRVCPVTAAKSNNKHRPRTKHRENLILESRALADHDYHLLSHPHKYVEEHHSDDSDYDSDSYKRYIHNVLERKRRTNLAWDYHMLQKEVPAINRLPRGSKVLILTKAAEHVKQLCSQQNSLQSELERLQRVKERLKWRLQCHR